MKNLKTFIWLGFLLFCVSLQAPPKTKRRRAGSKKTVRLSKKLRRPDVHVAALTAAELDKKLSDMEADLKKTFDVVSAASGRVGALEVAIQHYGKLGVPSRYMCRGSEKMSIVDYVKNTEGTEFTEDLFGAGPYDSV
ncbi:hypothetical protein HN446_03265 [bacterium]|jgi:hypothetical protein|nr:hypothetical protein [bacterium]